MAPATLTGSEVSLQGDALLDYASGSITAIAAGASLTLNGVDARLADAADITSNSALTMLASNAGTFDLRNGAVLNPIAGTNFGNTGVFNLMNGASITPGGWNNLTNAGSWNFDTDYGSGGTTLTLAGTLSNSGQLQIGANNNSLSANDTLTVAALANTGAITLWGNANGTAAPSRHGSASPPAWRRRR